jgi:hypothetical protein
VHGSAIALPMGESVQLTFDEASSTFTLDAWTWQPGSAPSGGELSTGRVTLTGDDPLWSTCEGPARTDTLVDGVCGSDLGAFELHSDAAAE